MRETNIFEKILASIINIIIVFIIFLPFLFIVLDNTSKKLILISLFFVYSRIFSFLNKGRDLGMIAIGTYWKEEYPLWNQLIYSILYTASFATLFFWIYFPFDLFLFNMIILQLPCILLTGTTLHGYLSGKMITVKGK